jgi:hypothetical protein
MSSSGAKEGGDDIKKYDLWRTNFEEKAREMRAIEDPKIQRMNNSELQAQVERLNRCISIEEACSDGSREHVKLLWEYEEMVNTQIMRNMQAGMTMSTEIITTLEENIKIYKVDLAK